jgi:energy-coupling factor transporter transmembrane protein EcfT
VTSPADRAHPFTLGAVALAAMALAVTLPAPRATINLFIVTVLVGVLAGAGRGIRLSFAVAAPFWVLLFIVHVLLGADGRVPAPWGGSYSTVGLAWALDQGSRLGAIIAASVGFASVFDPHRFLQAAIERRWPFSVAFLVVATLDAATRFTDRAHRLREAQRTRGLRVTGSLATRVRAVPALIFPLLLASITEADDHALALETRGLTLAGHRTATDPPRDSFLDRAIRWGMLLLVLAALAWRFLQ